MSGFFGTFILLVVAMAGSQWLTTRVQWAPRVVYVGSSIWLLALVFAAASFTTDPSITAVNVSLERIHNAAWAAQWAAIGTLVAVVLTGVYAMTLAPQPGSET